MLEIEPCKNHSDVTVPRLYWRNCDMIENPPSVNDGEDEEEEVESLRHEGCLLGYLALELGHLVQSRLVMIPLADL